MDKLVEVLAEQFGTTIEYAKQYLPDLIIRYGKYEAQTSIVALIIGVMLFSLSIIITVLLVKGYSNEASGLWDHSPYKNEPTILGASFILFTGCLFISGIIIISLSIGDYYKAISVPELLLLNALK